MRKTPPPTTPRGPGYLFTGFILGLALGLAISWWLLPVEYRDVAPASLRTDFKGVYRTLIAVAYWARPDPVRARARLELLQDPAPLEALRLQAQQALAQSPWPWEPEALALLVNALEEGVPSVAAAENLPPTPPQATPTMPATPPPPVSPTAPPGATLNPTAVEPAQETPGATPTVTLVPTPIPLFRVVQRENFCDPLRQALLHIEVYDAEGQPLAGIPLEISWARGQERLVTGLKPELGLGYADFQMDPNTTYRLRVITGSEILTNVAPLLCRAPEGAYPGGLRIVFQALP